MPSSARRRRHVIFEIAGDSVPPTMRQRAAASSRHTGGVAEGDTIHRLAERISARLAGTRVTACVTRDPRLVGVDLAGAVLLTAVAVGKHLLVHFDDGRTLHAHLGMDGAFVVGGRARQATFRRRLELTFDDGSMLTAVDVPVLAVLGTGDAASVVGHLGPDLCGTDPPDAGTVASRWSRDPAAPLAAALLDQRNVAGLGNVFAVEVPFICGVAPGQPIGGIDRLELVASVATALLRWSAANGVRNTTGRNLRRPAHWVYGRAAQPCPLCGTHLAAHDATTSPWRRVSVWCPACQPRAERRPADASRVQRLLALHPARRTLELR